MSLSDLRAGMSQGAAADSGGDGGEGGSVVLGDDNRAMEQNTYLDVQPLADVFEESYDADRELLYFTSTEDRRLELAAKKEQFRLTRLSMDEQKRNNKIMISLTLAGLIIMIIKKKGG